MARLVFPSRLELHDRSAAHDDALIGRWLGSHLGEHPIRGSIAFSCHIRRSRFVVTLANETLPMTGPRSRIGSAKHAKHWR
jgi:hypothetical protein